ncbi:Zinc finger, CCHC-type [Cucumis melo var. makuwa]|uniref:Zinc finger, CCHC-type n=1 Tax=Cucumis melo var. makuwa TaxID=1194695 RepID=A0A5A7TZT5_CUCMM|nr:Zinc finger, CCHC-type [Cucumis melo var. makuwa]TYK26452.1 Zinc finger, CCHC-type [Cucumis melo var. makuwa]
MAQKLQALRQGSRSVEDYSKEMDNLMDQLDLDEKMETLMARVLNGLNKEIADKGGHVARDCLNKKTMTIQDGEVVTEGEESENEEGKEEIIEVEETSDGSFKKPIVEDALVTRRALSAQVKEDLIEEQRETVFHTRCHVNGKARSVIIDGGSCTNVVSTLLVKRLCLSTTPHPRP